MNKAWKVGAAVTVAAIGLGWAGYEAWRLAEPVKRSEPRTSDLLAENAAAAGGQAAAPGERQVSRRPGGIVRNVNGGEGPRERLPDFDTATGAVFQPVTAAAIASLADLAATNALLPTQAVANATPERLREVVRVGADFLAALIACDDAALSATLARIGTDVASSDVVRGPLLALLKDAQIDPSRAAVVPVPDDEPTEEEALAQTGSPEIPKGAQPIMLGRMNIVTDKGEFSPAVVGTPLSHWFPARAPNAPRAPRVEVRMPIKLKDHDGPVITGVVMAAEGTTWRPSKCQIYFLEGDAARDMVSAIRKSRPRQGR